MSALGRIYEPVRSVKFRAWNGQLATVHACIDAHERGLREPCPHCDGDLVAWFLEGDREYSLPCPTCVDGYGDGDGTVPADCSACGPELCETHRGVVWVLEGAPGYEPLVVAGSYECALYLLGYGGIDDPDVPAEVRGLNAWSGEQLSEAA